jgi:hypothetical protein
MIELGENVLDPMSTGTEPDEQRRDGVCLSTAELAECTCPDFCERDHDVD